MIDVTVITDTLGPPGSRLADADGLIPPRPGLYAIHATERVWRQLGLGSPPNQRPLYVGKSESSLADRDVRTHFGNGRTGSSTVRRSFAALLADELDLTAQPRNPARPERFANYGLPPEQDDKLTRWMREHLRISVWVDDRRSPLIMVETEVISWWKPPLNLTVITTQWTSQIKAARSRLAAQARAAADQN